MSIFDGLITDMIKENNCSRQDLDRNGMKDAMLQRLIDSALPEDIQDALTAAREHQESRWDDRETSNARIREGYAAKARRDVA